MLEKDDRAQKSSPVPITRAERYRTRLEAAKKELGDATTRLQELEDERNALQARVAQLATTVEILEPICAEQEEEEEVRGRSLWGELASCGIQECCYRILVEAREPLDATMIRSRLEQAGVSKIKDYANPLAVIHTSLKRMPERVRSVKKRDMDQSGRTVWVRFYEAIG